MIGNSPNWKRRRNSNVIGGYIVGEDDHDDEDEDDDEQEDRSLDLLIRLFQNVFRTISRRARKAVRSVLPADISSQLVFLISLFIFKFDTFFLSLKL